MKIGFVCASAATIAGGIETTVLELAKKLSARHEVVLLAGRPAKGDGLMGFTFDAHMLPFVSRTALPASPLYRNPYLLESASLYASFRTSHRVQEAFRETDVLSTHAKFDSLFFSRWGARRRIPTVFHVQGSRFGNWFRHLDQTARYVAVSECSRRELEERFHLPFSSTIPPGVPDELITAHREEQDFILFVSRLQPSKGPMQVVQVSSKLMESFPRLQLVVIGDGPSRARMEAEARQRGIGHRTIFLGALSHDSVLPYYLQAKLLLFPSRQEVFGLVPLEALAAGCPVLASDIPALTESTGGNAVLLHPDDLNGWVSAATRLLHAPGERKLLGDRGRAWASMFMWTKVAQSYELELKRAVGEC